MNYILLILLILVPTAHPFPRSDNEKESSVKSNVFLPLILNDQDVAKSVVTVFNNIKKYYLPLPSYITNEDCETTVLQFLVNFQEGTQSWSLKMADSWGKIPDGFLFGNIHVVGMYEECLEIEDSVTSSFEESKVIQFAGKYCKIFYEHLVNESAAKSGPLLAGVLDPAPFYYSTCIPSVCSDSDLFVSLNATLKELGRKISKLECREEAERNYARKFDGFDCFVCVLLFILITLALSGTFVDEHNAYLNYKVGSKERIALEVIKCFSITSSFKYIFRYERKSEKRITCMHGLRAITLIWIITCHQYEIGNGFLFNTIDSPKYQDPVFGQFITDGYPSVNTFLCISGILLTYRLFPLFLNPKSSGTSFYFKGFSLSFCRRVMRLLPSIFVVAVFCATLLRYVGWGHRQTRLEGIVEECRDTWWRDPLFINNLFIGDDVKPDCLSHCWYTAVEMQLFIITPLIFLPFLYTPIVGFLCLGFLTFMSSLIPVIILLVNDLPPSLFPSQLMEHGKEYLQKYYQVPWCRSAPWFVGLWTGIILVLQPTILKPLKKRFIILGYTVAILVGVAVVVGLYRYNHLGEHWYIDQGVSAVYAFFAPPAWGVAVSFVVITCHFGFGGYANNVLSWWGWQPISRLTFCMYLVSLEVQYWWTSVQYLPTYYSYFYKLYETCGTFFVSFLMAVLLCVLVERPFLLLSQRLSSSRVAEK